MGEALVENGLAGGNVLMLGGSAVDATLLWWKRAFARSWRTIR